MKNKIFLLVLLNLSLMSYGQIKFNGNFESGYEDRLVGFYDSTIKDLNPSSYFKNNLYGTLKLNSEFKGFSIYGINKISFFPYNIVNYNLELNEYQLGARYTYKCFFIGYDHLRSYSIDAKYFSEAYDRFFLGTEFSNIPLSCKNFNVNGGMDLGYEDRYFKFYDIPQMDPYNITRSRYNFYSVFRLSGNIRKFSIYASNKTYFSPDNLFNYNPLLIEYILGVKFEGDRFSFGWENMCTHAIEENYFRDGYDRVFLKIKLFDKKQTNSQ